MPSAALDAISYEDLYARWERGNWSATAIDFSEDRRQWEEVFTPFEREAALWNYALFFWGEDAVADNLGPFIDAAPREEQKYFLTTQQVDEARHAVFFRRFMHEVAGLGDGTTASGLAAIQPRLNWGFKKVFGELDAVADGLRRDRSIPRLAGAVALYHIVIEATLAQPGQHFIERYLNERDLLPGFREGIANVAADEQRHIGFGVRLLADLIEEDPRSRDAVAAMLRRVIPWSTAVFWPPGGNRDYVEVFGTKIEDVAEEGAHSLMTKLRSAGLPPEDLPGGSPIPVGLPPREAAERGLALMGAGILGPKERPNARDPETVALVFDVVARSVDPEHGLTERAVVQWDFDDLAPWHLVIDNGSTSAHAGAHPDPGVRLRCTWEDWADVVGGRADARRLLVTRRLRPSGSLRLLARMPRLFPPRGR